MVCTTQPPRGCTPAPPFKKRSSSANRENYAFSNEQNKKHTIIIYVRMRAREASGREKLKTKKTVYSPSFFILYSLKLNIISILVYLCTLYPFLCKNSKKYLHFVYFAKWSLQNDR